MLAETGQEERLPVSHRWEALSRGEGIEQLEHYRQLLLDLGNPKKTKDRVVLAIFTDAQTKLRRPTNLEALTEPSISSTGFRPETRSSAISMKAYWRRTQVKRNRGQGNTSLRVL